MSYDDPFMNEDTRLSMIASNCTPQRWQPAWERPDANTATLPAWEQLTDGYKRYIYGDAVINAFPEATAREWNARSRSEKKFYFLKPITIYSGNAYCVTRSRTH